MIWRSGPKSILGVGPGLASKDFRGEIGKSASTHTEFSRLVAEHGTFGLSALLVLLFAAGRRANPCAPGSRESLRRRFDRVEFSLHAQRGHAFGRTLLYARFLVSSSSGRGKIRQKQNALSRRRLQKRNYALALRLPIKQARQSNGNSDLTLKTMKTPILLVGNFLSATDGNYNVCEDLAVQLATREWPIITTSNVAAGQLLP
ncbi:MAG: hypothetical protein WKF84_20635 [Pyrinomonadaceae bacterium]